MMNIVALSWLLLSLVTAGVWSPELNQQAEQKTAAKLDEEPKVVMREGHRLVMIEFEREGVLGAAKKGTQDTFHTAADLAKATGENIRHAASQARDTAEVAGEQTVHVIKSGADKTKEAVKSTAGKASHAIKEKAASLLHGSEKEASRDEITSKAERKPGQIYDSAKEKVSETVDSIKDGAAGAKERVKDTYREVPSQLLNPAQQQVHYEESRVEHAENKTLKSVGEYIHEAEESLKDAAQKVSDAGTERTERIRDVKDEAGEKYKENVTSVKESAEHLYDSGKDKSRYTVLDKVSGAGLKAKDTVEDTYDSVKDKVSGGGQTVKESVKESYDSAKGKVSDASEKIKGGTEKTYDSAKDFAYRAKDSLGFDRVGHEGSDVRIQRALRDAGEAAIENFRRAMDEAYRMATNEDALRKAGYRAEKKIIPVLSEDTKDAAANVEAAAIRATDLVKDAATNLSAGSSKGSRLMVSRVRRLTSQDSLKVGTRMLHLFAFSTIYGSSVWVNFLAGHVMANAIPRQQFGFIQSKMYPVYFKTMAYGLATCLLAHSALHPWKSEANIQRWQDYNLLFSLALTLLNMLCLEPRATKAMFEKLRIEKEEGRGTDVVDIRDHRGPGLNPCHEEGIIYKMARVNRKLKLVHRISSTVNMLTLMGLTWHLAYLSSFIKS